MTSFHCYSAAATACNQRIGGKGSEVKEVHRTKMRLINNIKQQGPISWAALIVSVIALIKTFIDF